MRNFISAFLIAIGMFSTQADSLQINDFAETRPTRRLANFGTVFNGGRVASVEQFIRENFTNADDSRIKRLRSVLVSLRNEFGLVSVAQIRDIKDRNVFIAGHVIAKVNKSGKWKSFQFFTNPKQEGRFTSFAVADAIEPRELPEGDIENPQLRKWLADHIGWLEEEHKLSGAFLVALNGKPIFKKVCGWRDRERKHRNSETTPFNLASGGKMFTGIAIGQLVEKGKLAFEDKISAHLPDYPDSEIARSVSIHNLLTHCSGLPEYWTVEFEKDWLGISQLEEILPYFNNRPLSFAPGTKHEYCNTNFIVLGLIIEAASSQNYYEYISEHVFQRAAMKHAGFFEPADVSKPIAKAYEFVLPANSQQPEEWHIAALSKRGSSAGGCYASLDDMLHFDQALNQFRLVGKSTTRMLTSGKVAQPVGGKYGYGFMEGETDGQRWFGHGGTGPGSFFNYRHFPDTGYSVVYVANHEGTAAFDAFQKLVQSVVRLSSNSR